MPKVEIIISMRVNDLENELLNFNEKVFLMADTEYFRFIRIQYSFKMSHYIKVAYRSQKAHLGRFITWQSRIHYKRLRNCISLPDSCNFREIIKSLKRTIIKFSKTAENSRFGSWKLHNFWWHFHLESQSYMTILKSCDTDTGHVCDGDTKRDSDFDVQLTVV